jgi:hypothetical protein
MLLKLERKHRWRMQTIQKVMFMECRKPIKPETNNLSTVHLIGLKARKLSTRPADCCRKGPGHRHRLRTQRMSRAWIKQCKAWDAINVTGSSHVSKTMEEGPSQTHLTTSATATSVEAMGHELPQSSSGIMPNLGILWFADVTQWGGRMQLLSALFNTTSTIHLGDSRWLRLHLQ